MMKKYKNKLIISSLVIFLPTIIGLIMWDKLPDTMVTHWGMDGTADGFSPKIIVITIAPLLLLLGHLFCVWITLKTNKDNEQSEKVLNMMMWIMPVISLFTSYTTYSVAMGNEFGPERTMPIFIGLMFIVIGNYLPKTRMNSTIGIKIPTTYSSEANWNATHRMAGKLWMAGGMLTMLSGLFDEEITVFFLITAVFMMAFIPMIYSYIFYRREKAEGKDVTTKQALPLTPAMLKMRKLSMVGVAAVLVFVVVIMFAGDIEYEMSDESFEIKADFYEDLTVRYDSIDNIEYVENLRTGIRTYGFGSARLLMGNFTNDEFGNYTLYAYTGADAHVVMEKDGKHLVISAKTVEETQALYENLLERMGK